MASCVTLSGSGSSKVIPIMNKLFFLLSQKKFWRHTQKLWPVHTASDFFSWAVISLDVSNIILLSLVSLSVYSYVDLAFALIVLAPHFTFNFQIMCHLFLFSISTYLICVLILKSLPASTACYLEHNSVSYHICFYSFKMCRCTYINIWYSKFS